MKIKYLILFIYWLLFYTASADIPVNERIENVPGAGHNSSPEGNIYNNYGVIGQPIVGTESSGGDTQNQFGIYIDMFGFEIVTTAVTFPGGYTLANSGGTITNTLGKVITGRGICYSTNSNPSLTETTGGGIVPHIGDDFIYVSPMTGLQPGVVYYVVAYATHSDGTSYGQVVSFTTIPTLPQWGLIAFVSLIGLFGGWYLWKRS